MNGDAIAWPTKPAPICCNTRRILSIGIRGAKKRLAKAKRENKLIFLSIGYSSCHWCHVMERESFTDDEIATFMNNNFVCIKVDREERPDVDAIYMMAVQMITQRGGWPLSVFLTPDGKPFFGGTYFPCSRWRSPGWNWFPQYHPAR